MKRFAGNLREKLGRIALSYVIKQTGPRATGVKKRTTAEKNIKEKNIKEKNEEKRTIDEKAGTGSALKGAGMFTECQQTSATVIAAGIKTDTKERNTAGKKEADYRAVSKAAAGSLAAPKPAATAGARRKKITVKGNQSINYAPAAAAV